MASELSLSRPRTALTQLRETAIPLDAPLNGSIELVITVDSENVNVRGLSAYLKLIDNTYGRLSERGLLSYSQNSASQLRVAFRSGSLEIIISEILSHADSVTAVIIIRYLLKYLPTTLKDVASAYREYEEALMVRERRRQLREEIKQDQELDALDNNRKNEIVAFLDSLYYRERRQLPAAQRFAARYVKKIILRIVDADEKPEQKKMLGE